MVVHSAQVYIQLKPLFSRHNGIGVQFTDEPTGALDTASGFEVMRLFRELIDDEDITIVMTTHDPNLMELGDEVFELSDGIVI